ncbi:hypothetical protein M3484_19840 [Pseudomonas sp. GX19020]|uniref:hypothetical protein n=1 Tax=Pseudomonadota TaxID=1224 RepID=UPI000895DBB7|nr:MULTISPECIES: hypothetical protein [Pseudomonadota]MCL4068816.1 hypothetical protein [Pseudomonas sp. GX19020]SED43721.1 hypothetical protein SAMN05519105_3995 [Rhodobacter sp. 24-YEA-8]
MTRSVGQYWPAALKRGDKVAKYPGLPDGAYLNVGRGWLPLLDERQGEFAQEGQADDFRILDIKEKIRRAARIRVLRQ